VTCLLTLPRTITTYVLSYIYKKLCKVEIIAVITTSWITIATDSCIKVIYTVGYKPASSLLVQCIVSILRVLILFWCGYVKRSVLYKGAGLRMTICAGYSCEMALSTSLGVSLDNMRNCKGIYESVCNKL
jgi:hypothetical protein